MGLTFALELDSVNFLWRLAGAETESSCLLHRCLRSTPPAPSGGGSGPSHLDTELVLHPTSASTLTSGHGCPPGPWEAPPQGCPGALVLGPSSLAKSQHTCPFTVLVPKSHVTCVRSGWLPSSHPSIHTRWHPLAPASRGACSLQHPSLTGYTVPPCSCCCCAVPRSGEWVPANPGPGRLTHQSCRQGPWGRDL